MTLAQLINVLYSVVDRIYIGHLPHASAEALTGIGLCLPIITIISAFANLFGMGGAPLCSIARGGHEEKRAQKVMGNSFSMLLLTGAVLMILCLVLKRPILYLFGASEATYGYANDYITIYLLGTIFVMVSLGMNNFINAQGFGKMGMLTVLLGAVMNIILDPVLIFGFDMGVRGAAIATVISQGASALWVFIFLTGKKSPFPAYPGIHEAESIAGKGYHFSGDVRVCHVCHERYCSDRVQCSACPVRRGSLCGDHDGDQFRAGDCNSASERTYIRSAAGYGLQLRSRLL